MFETVLLRVTQMIGKGDSSFFTNTEEPEGWMDRCYSLADARSQHQAGSSAPQRLLFKAAEAGNKQKNQSRKETTTKSFSESRTEKEKKMPLIAANSEMTSKGHRTLLAFAFIEKKKIIIMLLKQPNRNRRKSKQTNKQNALDNTSESFLFSFGLGVSEKIHKGTNFFRMGMKDV